MTAPALPIEHPLPAGHSIDFAPRRRWPTSVLVLAASGLAARGAMTLLMGEAAPLAITSPPVHPHLAAWLEASLAPEVLARLLMSINLAASVACVLLTYSFVRNITDRTPLAWSHLAAVTAAGLAAFWPTQLVATSPSGLWPVLGLLLLTASAFWVRGNGIASRLGFCGAMVAAACLAPVTAAGLAVALPAVLLSKDASPAHRLGGILLLTASAVLVGVLWRHRVGDLPPLFGRSGGDSRGWIEGVAWQRSLWPDRGWIGTPGSLASLTLGIAALAGVLAAARRRPSLTALVILLAAACAASASQTPGTAWRHAVEPLLIPWVGLLLVTILGSRMLPKERPPIVKQFLASRRTNAGF